MNDRRWSQLPATERAKAIEPANRARLQKYLDAVPVSVTDPAERERLARQARKADMTLLAFKSARARKAAREGNTG